MKKIKLISIFGSLMIGGMSVALVFSLSSCSNNVQKYYSYIQDRTFSLAAKDANGWHTGTAWIFDKAKNATNDYTYYAATAMHVQFGFENAMTNPEYFFEFGDQNNETKYDDYHSLTTSGDSPQFEWMGDNTLNINNNSWQYLSSFTREDSTVNLVVDISVMKVDFSNYIMQLPNLKTRLDKLNALDKIVTFAPNIKSANSMYNQTLYVGGYADVEPKDTQVFTHWSTKYDKPVGYTTFDGSYNSHGHSVDIRYDDDDRDNSSLYSNALEVQLSSNKNVGHGASGSMVINQDYQVVGIFWGGFKDDTPDPDEHGYCSIDFLNSRSPFTYGMNNYNVMEKFYSKF